MKRSILMLDEEAEALKVLHDFLHLGCVLSVEGRHLKDYLNI